MLTQCKECAQQISDRAETCPHCGVRIAGPAENTTRNPTKGTPVFLVLATVGLFLCLFTPRILLSIPLMATLGLAVLSFIRRERWRGGSIAVFLLGISMMFWGSSSGPSVNNVNLDAVQISDWNWKADPSFGGRGTIKWNVSLKNMSNKNIRDARVELTTYDKGGKLVSTTFTYVHAIPPGEIRSDSSFADYYRTEAQASIKVVNVIFSE
ncbi:MAG TPA: FxLYD domain-containing protein [Magnetospirillum sp.]|nr:FxLYD domain-containing protein [Magnetospirillum sp.]